MDTARAAGEQVAQALTDADTERLIEALVASLRREAPRGTKCLFLNAEMRLSKSRNAAIVSGDLFALTAPLLRPLRRNQRTLNVAEVRLLDEIGLRLMNSSGRDYATLDILVDRQGRQHTFVEYTPLRRIGGDDDFFKSKHKSYVALEPLLAGVD